MGNADDRFRRGVSQVATPIWIASHDGDPGRNRDAVTGSAGLCQHSLRTPSTRADPALPTRRNTLPRPLRPTGPAGEITTRSCPQGIQFLPEVRPPRARVSSEEPGLPANGKGSDRVFRQRIADVQVVVIAVAGCSP